MESEHKIKKPRKSRKKNDMILTPESNLKQQIRKSIKDKVDLDDKTVKIMVQSIQKKPARQTRKKKGDSPKMKKGDSPKMKKTHQKKTAKHHQNIEFVIV